MIKTITGKQLQLLRDALVSAFPTYQKLEAMMLFELDTNLPNIAEEEALLEVALNIINWARAEERLEELISGAINQNPRNAKLKQFAIELSLVSKETPSKNGGFEAIVLQNSPFQDVVSWRSKMEKIENCVCRIEINRDGVATGFLINADTILTNCHVSDLITDYSQVIIRFDFKENNEGTENVGKEYKLSENYLIDKSDKYDLDFALIKLAESAGNEVIGESERIRGWLEPKNYNFQIGEIQLILQHPDAKTLKISAGAVSQIDNTSNRITYTANTQQGSSGSPVFTLGWDLVALHHYGNQTGNIGIPLSAIWSRLEGRNSLGELRI